MRAQERAYETKNSLAWKGWEQDTLGPAHFYITLTRPAFAFGAKLNLGADGFWSEARRWFGDVFTRKTGGHTHIVAWREPDGGEERNHLHAIVRCERPPALSCRQLEDEWFFWWVKDPELAACLSNINIQAKVERYDPSRSRAYLMDHHEFVMETICSHPRPCRRGCRFKHSPEAIKGWLYKDGKPLRS